MFLSLKTMPFKDKEKKKLWERKYRKRKFKEDKDFYRKRNLRDRFGITKEEYDKMLKEQNGRCAICDNKSNTTLAVDHDHKTGLVRGRLCMTCNKGLSLFRDDSDLLFNAANYLYYPPVTVLLGENRYGRTGRVNKKVKRKKKSK